MGINHLLRSNLRTQLGSYMKNVTATRVLQDHTLKVFLITRNNSTEASIQKEDSVTDLKSSPGFKGHDMLAPFTAGWQTSDLHPLVIEKSEGSYVYDINGKKYLDSLAGLWCTALGGNEPRLVAAATSQLNTLPFYHSFWNRTTKPSLDLAKELLETFKASKMAKAFFTNSGSEANDTQVKLVWYYNNALGRPNKKKFIARAKSYHGSTLISASLSGLPALHQKFDLPAPFVLHTDCPHYWRFHLPGETEEEFATRLANNLENLILKEGPEAIAAFIAEPVMGAGGVIPPPATYFDKIQPILKKYDILFIGMRYLVICAFGRLGTMYGCDKYNIKPDLVSIAKALSSGYMPIGAVLVNPEVSEVIYSQSNKLGTFSHGFTYSGHPVSCAVTIEALKIYNELFDSFIRGTGLILGTEFTNNKSPNDPFPPEWGKFLRIGAYFGAQCEKHGMLVRVSGDNIMMSPPFIISPEEVDQMVSIYGQALKDTEERVLELKSQQK
ncbi:hypothetical protein FNV43_RR14774 [Rhamnella rubrinervis]|uniref:Uncharacterized protein n=1 Tax=Rhamnella rubrinervis TaxID=2594499 RepID=A0A8K0H3F3_9ROSA|nr:hypothetical protein FNV43_RR14774 [Rhamnella rubrinervis]